MPLQLPWSRKFAVSLTGDVPTWRVVVETLVLREPFPVPVQASQVRLSYWQLTTQEIGWATTSSANEVPTPTQNVPGSGVIEYVAALSPAVRFAGVIGGLRTTTTCTNSWNVKSSVVLAENVAGETGFDAAATGCQATP